MCSTLPPNLPPCRISCPRATSMTGAPGISGPLLLVRSPAKPWNPQTNWKTSGAMEHSYTFFFTYLYKFEFDDHEPQHKECPRKWLSTPCSQSVRDSSSLRLSNTQCILLVEYYPGWYCHVLSKSRSMDSIIRTCNRNPTFKPVEGDVIDLVPFSVHSALNTDIAGMTATVHNG